jgi:integrase
VESDPTLEVTIPEEADSEPVIVDVAMLRQIRDGCRDAEDLALFNLLAYAGLRRVEVRRLRWEHVNFKRSTVTVVRGKGRKLRHVPIHPVLAETLTDLPQNLMNHVIPGRQGGELADGSLHYRLRRLGLTRAHDFRRTVASSLYRNGVPTDSIDKILGWSPRVVRTRYYVNFAQADLQGAILRLYADDPL